MTPDGDLAHLVAVVQFLEAAVVELSVPPSLLSSLFGNKSLCNTTYKEWRITRPLDISSFRETVVACDQTSQEGDTSLDSLHQCENTCIMTSFLALAVNLHKKSPWIQERNCISFALVFTYLFSGIACPFPSGIACPFPSFIKRCSVHSC